MRLSRRRVLAAAGALPLFGSPIARAAPEPLKIRMSWVVAGANLASILFDKPGIAARLPPERFESWLFTKKDYYRDPDGLPDLDALQANVDLQHSLGFLAAAFDVGKYADLDFAKAAVQRVSEQGMADNRRSSVAGSANLGSSSIGRSGLGKAMSSSMPDDRQHRMPAQGGATR